MQRATLGKSGSEAASQLEGRIARAFSSNSFVNTMEMTTAIEYILTAAQSLGSQDYYRKSRMTILGLAGVFCENEQAQTKWIIICSEDNTWMLREAGGGLKATVGNRKKPDYHFIRIVFCSFLFLSARFLCSLAGYAQKHASTYQTLWTLGRLRFEEHIQICSTVIATLS